MITLLKFLLGLCPEAIHPSMGLFGGGGDDSPEEDPTSLRSTVFMEITEILSEGEIEGFATVDPLESVYFDGTPVKIGEVENFENVEIQHNTGANDQAYLPDRLDQGSASSIAVGVLVRQDQGGIVRTTSVPAVDKVRVTVEVPQLLYNDPSGDIRSNYVELKISVQPSGDPQYHVINLGDRATISGKTTSTYSRSFLFSVWHLGPAPYNIKVERVTPDSDGAKRIDALYWSSYTEIVDAKLRYPNSAIVKTLFDAEKFGSIPTRGYQLKGIKCQVPTNYNPVTRVYSGPWDGSFKIAWTNNPAWIFYDIATNKRYGLGEHISALEVDKGSLYTIGQYCDQDVDDGFGGTEPRFSCSVYLQKAADAYKVLTDLASVFRGMVYWTSSSLYCVQDTPKAATSQYVPANVVGGLFTYSGAGRESRPTVALVRWNDPQDGYRPAIEYIEDRRGIERYGVTEKQVNGVGVLSRGQAHRVGKYVILTGLRETEVVTFRAGMDSMFCLPGEVTKVLDPLKSSTYSIGGRLQTSDTNTLTLDREVVLSAGESYTATVLLSDGTLTEVAVTSGVGTYPAGTLIQVGTSFTAENKPIDGSVWSIQADSVDPRLFRVLSITELAGDDEGFYEITASLYDPTKLPDVDSTDSLGSLPEPPIDYTGIAPVSGLVLTEGVYVSDGTLHRYIDASWQPSAGPYLSAYSIVWRKPNGELTRHASVEPTYRIMDPVIGEHSLTIYAQDIAGRLSTGVAGAITIAELPEIATVIITGLELAGQGADTNFTGPEPTFTWRVTSLINQEIGDEDLGADTGFSDPWLQDYEIKVFDETGILLRTDHTTVPTYTYAYTKNLEDGGPNRTIRVQVAARDIYNRTGIPASLTVTNPPPTDFRSLEINTGFESIYISYYPPLDPDYLATRVYLSTIQDFTPDAANLVYEGQLYTIPLLGLVEPTYYLRIEGVDAFGPAGVYSNEYRVDITSVQQIYNQIAGQVTEGWLYQALQDRLDLIDGFGEGSVNERIDAVEVTGIVTFYQDAPPTDAEANNGDLWFDTNDNNHPYVYDSNAVPKWQDARDTSVTGISNYFEDGPTGPAGASVGDLWFDTRDLNTDGLPDNIPYYWDGNNWISVRDGLLIETRSQLDQVRSEIDHEETGLLVSAAAIDTLEATVIQHGDDIDATATALTSTQVVVDGKTAVYYQNSTPTAPQEGFTSGDIWIQTDNNNFTWLWNGSAWVDARDTSASGNATYFSLITDPPSSPATGDLWIVSDWGNRIFRWSGSTWQETTPDTVTGAQTYYVTADPPWPTGENGDLLFDARDLNTDSIPDNTPYRWEGGQWVLIRDNVIMATIAEEQTARINADNTISAEYTVKIDANGFVAGMGLVMQGGGSGPTESEFLILADRFAVGYPTSEFQASTAYVPNQYVRPTDAYIAANGNPGFVYRAITTGTTAGEPVWPTVVGTVFYSGTVWFYTADIVETIPFVIGNVDGVPSVVMSNAVIADASIGQAKIDEANITSLHAVLIDANQISTGTLNAGVEISVGGPQFKLLADDRKLEVIDDQALPIKRVELGRLGPTQEEFGIIIRDENGNIILSSGGDLSSLIDNSQQTWGDISGPGAPEVKLVDSADWVVSTGGAQPNWSKLGEDAENFIPIVQGPQAGVAVPAWSCQPDGSLGWDGGFVHHGFTINPVKTYRFSVWVYRVGDANGGIYFGPGNQVVGSEQVSELGAGDTPKSNPYFCGDRDLPETGKWYLMVSYVYTAYYASVDSPASGIYDPATGEKVQNLLAFKWRFSASADRIRAGFYNCATTSNRVYFYDPQVYLVTGYEPSIVAMLDSATVGATWGVDIGGSNLPADNADVTADNPQDPDWLTDKVPWSGYRISQSNISTFIDGAAIENAYIGEYIQSYSYGPGLGWHINKTGDAEFSSITIRDTSGQIMLTSGGNISERLDNLQQVYDDIQGEKPTRPLIDSSQWVTSSTGSQPGFTHVGQVSENRISTVQLLNGELGPVWRATTDGTNLPGGNADGGWITDSFPVHPNKLYRFSCWYRHVGTLNANAGNFYMGCEGNTVDNLSTGLLAENPYFFSTSWNTAGLVTGRWYLAVGYVFAWGMVNNSTKYGGLWDSVTGKKVLNASATFRWADNTITSSKHRAFMFYCKELGHSQDMWGPRVEVVIGAEQTPSALLGVADKTQFNEQDYDWVQGQLGVDKPPADADKTGDNVALSVLGQGDLAVLDQITGTYIANLTVGTLKLINGSISVHADVSGQAAVELWNNINYANWNYSAWKTILQTPFNVLDGNLQQLWFAWPDLTVEFVGHVSNWTWIGQLELRLWVNGVSQYTEIMTPVNQNQDSTTTEFVFRSKARSTATSISGSGTAYVQLRTYGYCISCPAEVICRLKAGDRYLSLAGYKK